MKKFPEQKFVIDHLAKPYIKDMFFYGWAVLMREIGRCENVSCKISGMVTEADYEKWNYRQLLRYFEVIVESFGTNRIMFGSDWPVCLVAAEYSEVKGIAEEFISSFSTHEKEAFWGSNAVKFYNL